MMATNKGNYKGYYSNDNNIYNGKENFEGYSTSPANLIKIKILESRNYVIDCITVYIKLNGNNNNYDTLFIRSALLDMFLQLRSMLKGDYNNVDDDSNLYLKIEKMIQSKDYLTLLEAFKLMDDYLFIKKMTKVDFIDNYDRTNAIEEDERYGL